MSRLCCRPLCLWSSLIRPFDRTRLSFGYVRMFCAADRRRSPRHQPSFDFGQIPDDAARRERKTPRELAALLHFVDRAVSQRHHLTQLMAPDGLSDCHLLGVSHTQSPSILPTIENDRCRYWKALWMGVRRFRAIAYTSAGFSWLYRRGLGADGRGQKVGAGGKVELRERTLLSSDVLWCEHGPHS